jgi:hypothetical protein
MARGRAKARRQSTSSPRTASRTDTRTSNVRGRGPSMCAPSGRAPPDDYSREQVLQCLTSVTTRLVKGFARRNWNRTSLAIAAAIGSRFEESDIRKGRGNGAGVWANHSRGLGTHGQGIFAATINHHRAETADSTYTAGSSGVRLLLGSPRLNGFAEGVLEARWNASSRDVTDRRRCAPPRSRPPLISPAARACRRRAAIVRRHMLDHRCSTARVPRRVRRHGAGSSHNETRRRPEWRTGRHRVVTLF